MSNVLEPLIGKTVLAVKLNQENDVIKFACTDGTELIFAAEGDCCSTSWFNDLIGVSYLLGKTVEAIAEKKMPDADFSDDFETIQVYGIMLTTNAGNADIIFRNSSNGYYGGYLMQIHGEISDYINQEFRFIVEDFSA